MSNKVAAQPIVRNLDDHYDYLEDGHRDDHEHGHHDDDHEHQDDDHNQYYDDHERQDNGRERHYDDHERHFDDSGKVVVQSIVCYIDSHHHDRKYEHKDEDEHDFDDNSKVISDHFAIIIKITDHLVCSWSPSCFFMGKMNVVIVMMIDILA